jgi:hypothetical protein
MAFIFRGPPTQDDDCDVGELLPPSGELLVRALPHLRESQQLTVQVWGFERSRRAFAALDRATSELVCAALLHSDHCFVDEDGWRKSWVLDLLAVQPGRKSSAERVLRKVQSHLTPVVGGIGGFEHHELLKACGFLDVQETYCECELLVWEEPQGGYFGEMD